MNFVIKGGEDKKCKTSTVRTYINYVTPTGAEQFMKYAPANQVSILKDERATKRLFTTEYETTKRFTIKIFTSRTTFGKPRENFDLYIHLDPHAEEIHITGLDGFGGFMGRGVIDLKKSNITAKVVREIFNYEVLSGPLQTYKPGLSGRKHLIY